MEPTCWVVAASCVPDLQSSGTDNLIDSSQATEAFLLISSLLLLTSQEVKPLTLPVEGNGKGKLSSWGQILLWRKEKWQG